MKPEREPSDCRSFISEANRMAKAVEELGLAGKRRVELYIRPESTTVLVTGEGGSADGRLSEDKSVARLEMLYVAEPRGRGVGSELLTQFAEVVKDLGASRIDAEVANSTALRLMARVFTPERLSITLNEEAVPYDQAIEALGADSSMDAAAGCKVSVDLEGYAGTGHHVPVVRSVDFRGIDR